MLADKKFAKFSQEIGLASLGTNESDLMKLATVSDFFYLSLIQETGFQEKYFISLVHKLACISKS